jgi:hypothetical protein
MALFDDLLKGGPLPFLGFGIVALAVPYFVPALSRNQQPSRTRNRKRNPFVRGRRADSARRDFPRSPDWSPASAKRKPWTVVPPFAWRTAARS